MQPLETMSRTSPALVDLFSRLDADVDRFPIVHYHASSGTFNPRKQIEPTTAPRVDIPGATADELVQARIILSEVYAKDIDALGRSELSASA